jgi:hypothetical protein
MKERGREKERERERDEMGRKESVDLNVPLLGQIPDERPQLLLSEPMPDPVKGRREIVDEHPIHKRQATTPASQPSCQSSTLPPV